MEKELEVKKARFLELEAQLVDFTDIESYTKISREYAKLKPIVDEYDFFLLATEAGEKEEATQSEARLRELLTPKDERDERNVIVEIRPAAGGDEAGLFAASLLRMYSMFAASRNYEIELNYHSESEIGGLKEASFRVIGDGAFATFKFESGVHRVQRVPDTETQGRIHTSTVTVAVLPEAPEVDFKIDEKDLKIDVYRASGAGGQHVNRTESAVRITHLPTNTVVTCQDGRSQIQNRAKALLVLQTKLADFYQEQADKEYSQTRKNQVGSGDRSERIRTYNFPQGRLTDHRINYTAHNLTQVMNGDLDALIVALQNYKPPS